uniref:Ribosomal protein S19 n=1 Tax=Tetrahymena paravorax TaxID=5905 RepID=Q09F76_TETPR|nr:ribosomal protein S19 [Tetrahymena paravorax]ABI51675.1 ribosomal protein S19 [Tetrahymena paravorax]
MSRSNWRLNFIGFSTMNRIIKESIGIKLVKKNSMIINKSSTIPQSLIDSTIYIHKGKKYRELKIKNYHVGFKFGEFILTKKPHIFPKKIKK